MRFPAKSQFVGINIISITQTKDESPERHRITPIKANISLDCLEKVSCLARILSYNHDQNTLAVELIVPEVFPEDEVLALEAGDMIHTGREDILIRTIDWYEDDGYLVINAGSYEHASGSVYLHMDDSGNYRPDRYGHLTYNTLAILECHVTEALLYLDYNSEDTGDALELPVVHTAAEFLEAFFGENTDLNEYEVGLNIDNVYVVFDGNGRLAVVARFFVSWQ